MPDKDTIDFLRGIQQIGTQSVIDGIDGNPDEAARALALSSATGFPAPVIGMDVPGFERQHKIALSTDIVNGNPYLRSYVDRSPMAAKVSADDFAALDNVSERVTEYAKPGVFSSFVHSLATPIRGAIGAAKGAVEGTAEGFGWENQVREYNRLVNFVDSDAWRKFILNPMVQGPIVAGQMALHAPGAVFGGIAGAVGGFSEAWSGESWANRLKRDVFGGLQVNLAGAGINLPLGGRGLYNAEVRAPLIEGQQSRGMVAIRPYLEAGREPPPGLDPMIDQMKAKQVETDLVTLESVLDAARDSATRERAPDMFAEFLREHTQDTISISADAIARLYGDKAPARGDGLLGWVPNLAEQMQHALTTNGDVLISVADYIARVDPTVHTALRDSIRTRPEGVTLKESVALGERQDPVDIVGYHGTAAETDFGIDFRIGEASRLESQPAFFSPTPELANTFADMNRALTKRVDEVLRKRVAFDHEMRQKYGYAKSQRHWEWEESDVQRLRQLDVEYDKALEVPANAAGPRVIPVKISLGKTATYDIERLFAENETFHEALRQVFTDPIYEHAPLAYSKDPVKLQEYFDNRMNTLREKWTQHENKRKRILEESAAEGEPIDIGPWKVPLDLISGVIKMAKDQGLDTVRITNLGESGEQIAVFNKTNIRPYFGPAEDAIQAVRDAAGIQVWHGSPHEFGAFDLSKIGTGEGAIFEGWGVYLAGAKGTGVSYQQSTAKTKFNALTVAESIELGHSIDVGHIAGMRPETAKEYLLKEFRDADVFRKDPNSDPETRAQFEREYELLKKIIDANDYGITKGQGNLYRAEILAQQEQLLDLDEPLSKQSEYVQKVIRERFPEVTVPKPLPKLNWVDNDGAGFRWEYVDASGEAFEAATIEKYRSSSGGDTYDASVGYYRESFDNIDDAKKWVDERIHADHAEQVELSKDPTGRQIRDILQEKFHDPNAEHRWEERKRVSQALLGEGIKGSKFLDQNSRNFVGDIPDHLRQRYEELSNERYDLLNDREVNAPIDKATEEHIKDLENQISQIEVEAERWRENNKTHNYVIFDEKLIRLLGRNDQPIRRVIDAATDLVGSAEDMVRAADAEVLARQAAEWDAKRQTKEWKDNERKVRLEVADAIDDLPAIQVHTYLTDGTFRGEKVEGITKLDRNVLPADIRDRLPDTILADIGVAPDDVAGFFGYRSGKEMVDELVAMYEARGKRNFAAFRRSVIDAETARVMEERFGPTAQEKLETAKEAAFPDPLMEQLHTQVTEAAAKVGIEYDSPTQIRERVRGTFDGARLREIGSDVLIRNAGAAGRAALAAERAGDSAEAFRQYQRQYVAVAMAREAMALEKEIGVLDRLAKRYVGRDYKRADATATDFIQQLLAQAGYQLKVSPAEIMDSIAQGTHPTLDRYVESLASDGWSPEVAEWLRTQGAKPSPEMTVAEWREFRDAIKSLDHIGRKVRKIDIAGEAKEWAEYRAEIVSHISQLPRRDRKGQDSFFYRVDSALTRMEEVIKDLDLRKEFGPLFRAVITPLMESKAKEFDLLTDLSKHFKETKGAFGKKWRKTLQDVIPNDLIVDPTTNTFHELRRENLLQIMLNWGNRSNIEKFSRGYAGLLLGRMAKPAEVAAFEARVKAMIDAHATKQDWEFVSRMWEPFRKWQPMTDTVSRNVSGVRPKWIAPEAIDTPFGRIEGGYWPVKYDRYGSNMAVVEDKTAATGLFGGGYFRAATAKSHLKERTGYIDAVDINSSIEQAAGVMQQTIHDIAFRDSLMQASKVLMDKEVRHAIRNHYGAEYEAQLMPWLKRIAKQYADERDIGAINDFMRRARINTIGHVLPLNLKVILSPDIGIPNPKRWAEYLANRSENVKLAMEKSNEIRHLVYNMDRDFREQMEAAFKSGKWSTFQREAVDFAFKPMMKISQEFRISTFVNEYRRALAEGRSEAEAAQIADSFVRERHGAASVVDLPAVMSKNEAMKSLTMFYGYFNTMYNWQRQIPGALREKDWKTAWEAALGTTIVGAGFGAALFNERTENDSWWKILGKALVLQPLQTIPGLRDMAGYFFEGFSPRTPLAGLIQAAGAAVTDVKRLAKGEPAKKPVQNTANVVGLATGLPLAQVGRTGEFFHDVYTREQRPRNIGEWWRGIISGESKLKGAR